MPKLGLSIWECLRRFKSTKDGYWSRRMFTTGYLLKLLSSLAGQVHPGLSYPHDIVADLYAGLISRGTCAPREKGFDYQLFGI